MSDTEGAPPPTPTPAPSTPEPGPSRAEQRIQTLLAEVKDLRGQVKVLSADQTVRERDELAAKVANWEKKFSDLEATHKAAELTWVRERTFMARGLVDPEGQAVAEALYGRLPEKDRPALDAWMDGWKTDDADNTPAALRHYLNGAAPSSQPPPAAPRPKLPGAPPAGSPGTLEAIPPELYARAAAGDAEAQKQVEAFLRQQRTRRA